MLQRRHGRRLPGRSGEPFSYSMGRLHERVSGWLLTHVHRMAAPASADITGFLGANTTPDNRPVKGVPSAPAFWSSASSSNMPPPIRMTPNGERRRSRPAWATCCCRRRSPIFGLQPYFTTGGGVYRERLASTRHTGFGLNTGGGVKISLAGPMRLRSTTGCSNWEAARCYSPAHRFYAGINLKF